MIPSIRTQYPITKIFGLNELPEPYEDAFLVNSTTHEGITYIGYSRLGVSEDDLEWLIIRKTVALAVTKYEYPNSSMEFNQAWSNRANLTYSR